MVMKDLLDNIKNTLYAKDMITNIHDAINQVYIDAIAKGNTNMEVVQARDGYKTLNERLNSIEGK